MFCSLQCAYSVIEFTGVMHESTYIEIARSLAQSAL